MISVSASPLEELKRAVCEANLKSVSKGLVIETFGNVSGADRSSGLMVIKPSGVSYDVMKPEQMVIVSLETGEVIEGKLRPSSDTATHLELYKAFPSVGGIVHTHSFCATAWAQACKSIPALGTTHADYFHGPILCTRPLQPEEINGEYEASTGKVIVECFSNLDPRYFPGVLVANHGPFTWGKDPNEAVHHAIILEYLARLASETLRINPKATELDSTLMDKHFFRKHGPTRYYGQL